MTDKQFAIFMYMNLFKQSDGWLMAVGGMKGEMKMRLNRALNANKSFLQCVESEIEKHGFLEQFYDDGECFSRVLEHIVKAPTLKEKETLIMIFREYSKGQLKVIEDIKP